MPWIAAGGVRLYYELHGRDDAPVLVLNNGILMNAAASWALQTPAFSVAYRVLLYDCRGQGLSDRPDEPYSMEQHADDLDALLSALGIESGHILGISYGGEVAQAFALAHPGRVRSLILADTVSEVGPELRLTIEGWKAAALTGDPDLLFLVTAPWNFSPAFIAARAATVAAARARYRDVDLAAFVRLCDAFLGVQFTDRLGRIASPTCVIVGGEDRLKGMDYAGRIHRAMAGSRLRVLPGAGHAACLESPAAFNEAVLGFLEAVEHDLSDAG
jgi:3-oxoadipate enol-lactonase